MTRSASIRRATRGSAMVELALAISLLCILLAAVMEFSRLFYFSIAVNGAARAGVQYASQDPANASDYTGMQTAALNESSNIAGLTATATEFCQCPDGTATTCGGSGCSKVRTYVSVSTSAPFHTLGIYPGIPNSITMNGQASMRVR